LRFRRFHPDTEPGLTRCHRGLTSLTSIKVATSIKIRGPPADPFPMRRGFVLGIVVLAGLTASACGGDTLKAHKGATVTAQPLIAPVTIPPTAMAVAGTPVVAAQNKAAQLEVAEQQYATCFAYAGLDQGLVGTALPSNTLVESCSTAGLTPAEVQVIQELIKAGS
jgi:hypothetical protein